MKAVKLCAVWISCTPAPVRTARQGAGTPDTCAAADHTAGSGELRRLKRQISSSDLAALQEYGARSGQLSVYALQKGIADGIADQYVLIQVLDGAFCENYQEVATASQTALKAANRAAGNDMYSTPFHEMYHCKEAQDYEAKYGKITADNYSEYIRELRAECKQRLDKAGITSENANEISEYAGKMYSHDAYDEVEAEYKTLLALRK